MPSIAPLCWVDSVERGPIAIGIQRAGRGVEPLQATAASGEVWEHLVIVEAMRGNARVHGGYALRDGLGTAAEQFGERVEFEPGDGLLEAPQPVDAGDHALCIGEPALRERSFN